MADGDDDGECVGSEDGLVEGAEEGDKDGLVDGDVLGLSVGLFDGLCVGLSDGCDVGFADGGAVGLNDGPKVVGFEGDELGILLGYIEGDILGGAEGLTDGPAEGDTVGLNVGETGEGVVCMHDVKDSAIIKTLHVSPSVRSATMAFLSSKSVSLAEDIRHKHPSGSSLLRHQRFSMTKLSMSCCPSRSICQKALSSSVCVNESSLLSMALDAANLDLFRKSED